MNMDANRTNIMARENVFIIVELRLEIIHNPHFDYGPFTVVFRIYEANFQLSELIITGIVRALSINVQKRNIGSLD